MIITLLNVYAFRVLPRIVGIGSYVMVLFLNSFLSILHSIFALQFALLEGSSVDDDLANLKKELSGSSKVCLVVPGLCESSIFL